MSVASSSNRNPQIVLNRKILDDIALRWLGQQLLRKRGTERTTIDLCKIEFISFFEGMILTNWLKHLCERGHCYDLDLIGFHAHDLPDFSWYLDRERALSAGERLPTQEDGPYNLAKRVYRLTGFLDNFGFWDLLDNQIRGEQIVTLGIGRKERERSAAYSGASKEGSSVLRAHVIRSGEDAAAYLEADKISSWRLKLKDWCWDYPVIANEEIWRVFAHELASNIVEHGGKFGAVGIRIIRNVTSKATGRLAHEWRSTFSSVYQKVLLNGAGAFLEVSVSDVGPGVLATLAGAWRKNADRSLERGVPAAVRIAAFAFDEFGTRKPRQRTTSIRSHALARILRLVIKYDGALTLRTNGLELVYGADQEVVEKYGDRLGYQPHSWSRFCNPRGAHLRVLLPLVPDFTKQRKIIAGRLTSLLPTGRLEDVDHPSDYVVPVSDAVGRVIGEEFPVEACASLLDKIALRPPTEGIVFDFSHVQWAEDDVDQFLETMGNLLPYRKCLLIELPGPLCSLLKQRSAGEPIGVPAGGYLSQMRRDHFTVLAIDDEGRVHFLGLGDAQYERALTHLAESPDTLPALSLDFGLSVAQERDLGAFLRGTPGLFDLDKITGRWLVLWDPESRAVARNRVLSRRLGEILTKCHAWLGEQGDLYIRQPWGGEWRDKFLFTSRVLEKKRYGEEAGLRLARRLEGFLGGLGVDAGRIDAVVCTSAPSALLASYVSKHLGSNINILDLGVSLYGAQPSWRANPKSAQSVIVIQDLVDLENMSSQTIELVRSLGMTPLVLGSFITFSTNVEEPRSTKEDALPHSYVQGVPHITLFVTKRPRVKGPPPAIGFEGVHWIEPYGIKPFSYKTRKKKATTLEEPQNQDERVDALEALNCIYAGHFTFDDNHFLLAANLQDLIASELGTEIASEIVDICMGTNRFGEEVTDILIPLHSGIQYIVPKLDEVFHARGRINPRWFSLATRLVGLGKAYYLPMSLKWEIETASPVPHSSGRRLLIIDDSIGSGRTLETLLYAIKRAVERNNSRWGRQSRPVDWVGVYTILNRTGRAKSCLLRNIETLSFLGKGIFFREFVGFSDLPVYDGDTCPVCKERHQLETLHHEAEARQLEIVTKWAENVVASLRPVNISTKDFHLVGPRTFGRKLPMPDGREIWSSHRALWVFYELMNRTYPVADLCESIKAAQSLTRELLANGGTEPSAVEAYDEFRLWSLLALLRNWGRVMADGASLYVKSCIEDELALCTGVLPIVLSLSAPLARHSEVRELFGSALAAMIEAEEKCLCEPSSQVVERRDRLYIGVQSFLLILRGLRMPPLGDEVPQVSLEPLRSEDCGASVGNLGPGPQSEPKMSRFRDAAVVSGGSRHCELYEEYAEKVRSKALTSYCTSRAR